MPQIILVLVCKYYSFNKKKSAENSFFLGKQNTTFLSFSFFKFEQYFPFLLEKSKMNGGSIVYLAFETLFDTLINVVCQA